MTTIPDPSSLGNYKMNGHARNGSVDSFEKTPSHFNSMDTSSYDLYDTQTHRTSSEFEEPLGGAGYVNRQTMAIGRPRPIPYSANGLPPPPPQVPKSQNGLRNVRADVLTSRPPQQPPYDLSFQNQHFRDTTPSIGSLTPHTTTHEYWGDSTGSNLNGHAYGLPKIKDDGAPSGFPRSTSMATASTFPLRTSTDDLSDTTSAANLTPLAQHQRQPYIPGPTSYHLSKSYDQLQPDQSRYQPPPRPSLPTDSPKFPYKETERPSNLFQATQSQPEILQQPEPEETPPPLPPPPPPPGQQEKKSPEMIRFESPRAEPRHYPIGFGPPRERTGVIETSLDDLDNLENLDQELDYDLDETTRPVSTYLETNMDSGDVLLPPIRHAQSQYIPSSVSPNRAARSRREREDELQALTSKSKSMPLETEM